MSSKWWVGGRIKEVNLTSPAKNNRANAELTRKLGELLDSKVAIVTGHKSRRKKLKTCLSEKELDEKFSKPSFTLIQLSFSHYETGAHYVEGF